MTKPTHVLVPINPTEEMVFAGLNASWAPTAVWHEMIAAAPPPPAPSAEAARIAELEAENAVLKLENEDRGFIIRVMNQDVLRDAKSFAVQQATLTALRAENTRLREALQTIAAGNPEQPWVMLARAALASAPAQPEGEAKRAPERPDLAALIAWAREHPPTDEQLAEQAKSWVRGEMAIDSDADEAEYRRRMREGEAQSEVRLPTPKSEPNLPSSFVFPKDPCP